MCVCVKMLFLALSVRWPSDFNNSEDTAFEKLQTIFAREVVALKRYSSTIQVGQ